MLISRAEIIERAESWLRRPVPYGQHKFHANEYGIYRADCSGYVSMAWGLPGKPPDRHGGLDTVGLAGVSVEVAKGELALGDVLIRSDGTRETRHVVLFAGWADEAGEKYWGYEQAGGACTALRLVSYPYETSSELYVPRRYVNVAE
ncbi:hypothetical protein Lesp02_16890 [Lentzea sp. NBRC 105346]|uniref:hypothetical protein n=1 Tax=Lentzea sp. NBRC 105346 TaxID=3032205 RepID=UPI0024A3C7A5|nr:hypothetical protein [Lentzea sp. NBRC 105346]GLZ29499.1 hypothetical protein Lesp02_16890 [Lentzea sp. NBRC 105346]